MGIRRWMCILILFAVALGVAAPPALAQQPAEPSSTDPRVQAAESIQITRTLVAAQRQLLVSGGMDLTPKEMEGFWPLYREYRLEMATLGDRLVNVILTFAESYRDLQDDIAGKLLDDFLAIEKARASLRAKFVPKFKTVLPVTKVARFYQIENKLDIAVLAEIAENVPLAR